MMMQTRAASAQGDGVSPFEPASLARRARAVAALAVLLMRYTRDESITLRIDGVVDVHLSRVADQPAAELCDEIHAQLSEHRVAARTYVDMAWRGADGETGTSLSLRVRLGSMKIERGESAVVGLFAVPDALSRVDRHFRKVIDQITYAPRTTVREARLLDGSERERLLTQLSRSEVIPELTTPGLLHELFESRAAETPHAVAVEWKGELRTYAELDARASALAAGLRSLGIGAGDFVAFQLPRSIDVYVAMLGILKAGAAYVPIDPEAPRDRVAYVLDDCAARALLCVKSLAAAEGEWPCPSFSVDEDWSVGHPVQSRAPRRATPSDPCYLIYTSGSSGAPKGVIVEHRSVVHLVRVEQHLFRIRSSDRIFQGFSVAFDAAVEEVWLAFVAGATLVAGSKDVLLADLPAFLTQARVTVFSTVPTLLSLLDGDLPGVRLLILGGEACPSALADRWATSEREVWNTYGPTETTVIATCSRLRAHTAVTIGRPIPNYALYILDAMGELAPEGVAGEICIGGLGVARGYLGREALSATRFVTNRFSARGVPPDRLYHTGDLGQFVQSGEVQFVGRIDDQVKLRGYRIELGEVEAALLAHSEVAGAVAVVRDGPMGMKQLVAYVVARGALDVEALKTALSAKLPPYMVPAHIELLSTLPTLASGKVDKRALPAPSRSSVAPGRENLAHGSPLEAKIARVWAEVLGVDQVRNDEDFFHLGGHSLLVAQVVSRLRREPELAHLSVLDVYECRTVGRLASKLSSSDQPVIDAPAPSASAGTWSYPLCSAAQLLGIYGLFSVHAMQWLTPYLTYAWLRNSGVAVTPCLVGAMVILFAVYPMILIVAVLAKWAIIGQYRAGRYPLFGFYYFRFWLVERLLAMAPTSLLVGTPLLCLYYRLLGARIGRDVHLASDSLLCFDLIEIGDDAAIGADADLTGFTVVDGELVIGPIRVGARCCVGTRSVLAPGASLEDDASLGELSLVPSEVTVPPGEHWAGSPATPAGTASVEPIVPPTRRRRAVVTLAYAVAIALLPAFVVIATLPGLLVLYAAEHRWGTWYLLAAPPVAVLFIALVCLEVALVKWLLVGRLRAGRYWLWGMFAFKRWLFERAMAESFDIIGGLYATLFLNPWLRLLGVRIGKNAEVSTVSIGAADLLDVGEGAFLADCVSIGAPTIERGWIELEEVRVGARAFVGNSAVVRGGSSLGANSLVGCLSLAPSGAEASSDGSAWVGSPALVLPQRQTSTIFPSGTTYHPSRRLIAQRYVMDFVRVILPTTCVVVLTCLLVKAALFLSNHLSLAQFLATFPLLLVACGLAAAGVVVACKWIVIGRYRSGERPLWSSFVWKNELVTALHENLAAPLLTDFLEGSPYLAWFFRALGAKVGRRVYMGTTELTEYDLVSIGDGACLNAECTLQTHLFEDRIMKMSTVCIGAHCTVGSDAVVLYDTHMESGAVLGPLSLLMKGETLPANTRWHGSPARPAAARTKGP
jgi:non-ribosomal peptide synthetase-like protein